MRRFLLTLSALLSINSYAAKNTYQIDLILFAHPQSEQSSIGEPKLPIPQNNKNTMLLSNDSHKSDTSYTLLPPSQSNLHDEYYLLNRKSNYKVLGRFTWRQKANSNSTVVLPEIVTQGWQIQGRITVRQNTYYLFNADLQCSSPAHPEYSFNLRQKHRLQANTTYYLDHQDVGMVVKIHKMA